MGAITADELQNAIFDHLVYAGTHGLITCFETIFNSLPNDVLANLLAFVNRHTEPRMFHPLPTLDTERKAEEKAALAAQVALIRTERTVSKHRSSRAHT